MSEVKYKHNEANAQMGFFLLEILGLTSRNDGPLTSLTGSRPGVGRE